MEAVKIYNLYPKLVGKMDNWLGHLDRIKDMGFNYIYLNPLHAPGFSGSDYAVKDYYLYHPLFVTGEMDFSNLPAQKEKGDEMLAQFCSEAAKKGIKVLMDLVINHTAIDSELTKLHPEWYMKNHDGTIKNPGALDGTNWVSWGDLAQIDNANSSDKDNLWDYWLDMMTNYCNLGIRGFRCDAAYHVPSNLWRFLIKKIKSKFPDAEFFAETLGCQTHELIETADTGFDYVMNSFKWWNLKDEWFIRLYREWAGKYPSITFPENHDTVRFAEEVHGNKNLAVMKYALSAYFCAGIAVTIGFEYGFKRKIDVVQTNPSWWEVPNYDISEEIKKINNIKDTYNVLREDSMIEMIDVHNHHVHVFTKVSQDGKEKILVAANGDGHTMHHLKLYNMHTIMGGHNVQDISHGHRMENVPDTLDYGLNPGEVKLFYIKY